MGTSFGNLPMCDDTYQSGAIFWLSEPLAIPWDLCLNDGAGRPVAHIGGVAGLPQLVVRIRGWGDRFAVVRQVCLDVAQQALDAMSVTTSDHLQLRSLRGEQEHLVWWKSTDLGHVLRYTDWHTFDPEPFLEPFKALGRKVEASLPPHVIAPPPVRPPWHRSFRYFRAAQLADDLANSFRNMFLALESVLDSVFPKAGSGLSENDWFAEAVRRVMPTCRLADFFATKTTTGSAVEHVLSIYRDNRLTTFHSKAGPESHLPFLVDDARHGELERAFADLSDLYLDLARTHLHLDRRVGGVLLPGGWDLATQGMLGATDVYVTSDTTPASGRVNELVPNPRGVEILRMHTRNAAEMEGPFERVFIGKSNPGGDSHPRTTSGYTVLVNEEPAFAGGFEVPLRLEGVDRFEIVFGCSYRRPDLRVSFKS